MNTLNGALSVTAQQFVVSLWGKIVNKLIKEI